MHFTHLSLKDFRSVDSLEIDISQTTVVVGRNGAGKTTVLMALNELIAGGHHPEHIRKGAKKAIIRAKLSDGSTVTKTITQKSSSLDIDSVTSAPQTWLNQFADKVAADPLALLDAKPADRGKAFTEALAVSVERNDLLEAAGMDLPTGIEEGHGLAAISRVDKIVREKRREANVAAKEKRSTIEQLAGSLPEVGQTAESLQEEKGALQREYSERVTEGRMEVASIDRLQNEKVQRLIAERDAKLDEIRRQYEEAVADARKAAEDEKTRVRSGAAPRLQEITQALARMDAEITQAAKAENTREVIARMSEEADALEAAWQGFDAALERLRVLEAKLMAESPIEGLTIGEDGEVYVGGIAFAQLNTAAQYDVLLDMAILRAGELGIILFDRLESLDAAEREAFMERARAKGVQVVAAQVSDGEFEVVGAGGDGAAVTEPADTPF